MEVISRVRSDFAELRRVSDLKVYEFKGHQGTDNLKSNNHFAVLMNSGGRLSVQWEGIKTLCNEVDAGDVIFSPSGSTISCNHREAVSSSFIALKQSVFVNASKDHVDYGSIDFTGRHIRRPVTTTMAMTLRNLSSVESYQEWPMLIESATLAFVIALISALSPAATKAFREKPYGIGDVRKKRVVEYIDAHLTRTISLAELAYEVGLSQYHFSRLFKKRFGMSIMEYISMRRVEVAKEKLQLTGDTLASIAHDCGFCSQSHFTGVFVRITGVTPAAYRNGAK